MRNGLLLLVLFLSGGCACLSPREVSVQVWTTAKAVPLDSHHVATLEHVVQHTGWIQRKKGTVVSRFPLPRNGPGFTYRDAVVILRFEKAINGRPPRGWARPERGWSGSPVFDKDGNCIGLWVGRVNGVGQVVIPPEDGWQAPTKER